MISPSGKKLAALAAPAIILAQPALADTRGDWATASDVGVGALTAWSIGVPVAEGDARGAIEAGVSISAAELAAQGLKATISERRPDGSDANSFPSGHASMAFSAATRIAERRGLSEGIPAFALAGFVGVARVQADKHYWHDVAAGAGIGVLSGILLTHARHPDRATMVWGDAHGAGVSYAMRF
ncbi:phosphatase PAP2 family protein [Aurantiacibacter spongiae]|nr:phosphatase PAP2 family protein [Aurantiacibacter spongiae]